MKCLLAVLAACVLFPLRAACAAPGENLAAVVAQIQAKPADRALREKAIAMAREIKPAPAVPAKAKRSFVMAATYQKEAKQPSDYALAVDALQDALTAAPWWGEAYAKLSVALESAGRFDEAAGAVELYLLTKPKDAEKAQDRLYSLEAKKNMAAKREAEAVASRPAPAPPAPAPPTKVTLDCQSTAQGASSASFIVRVDYAARVVDMPVSAEMPKAIGTAYVTAPATVTESSVDWNTTLRDGSTFNGSINRITGNTRVFLTEPRPDGREFYHNYNGPCRSATKQF